LNIHIKNREIPITAVIGGLATFITWFIVVYTHPIGRIVGFSWLAIGLLIYYLSRRKKSRTPTPGWQVERDKQKEL
jgi:APA family basic amino acid/polyamine antiporter